MYLKEIKNDNITHQCQNNWIYQIEESQSIQFFIINIHRIKAFYGITISNIRRVSLNLLSVANSLPTFRLYPVKVKIYKQNNYTTSNHDTSSGFPTIIRVAGKYLALSIRFLRRHNVIHGTVEPYAIVLNMKGHQTENYFIRPNLKLKYHYW